MMRKTAALRAIGPGESERDLAEARLDRVFFALSDPVRRAILERLDRESLLVSEIARPFDISLQAVSRHIRVLVLAGLVRQERTGRISRCSLEAGPICAAAVWINRYSKYWHEQFQVLAAALEDIEERRMREKPPATRRKRPAARGRPAAGAKRLRERKRR